MTPKQISALTLADIEAIAERLGNAARIIREAQSLLGGGAQVGGRPPSETLPAPPPSPPVSGGTMSPEQAEAREAWLKDPARAKLMEQFESQAALPKGMSDG